MVIAKPEWFNRRKEDFYSYGIAWQGWTYLIITISVLFVGLTLPKNIIIDLIVVGMFTFLFMDMIIASYRSMDERGKIHYSISMRNMAWGMIITIIMASIIIDYTGIKGDLNILIWSTALVGSIIGLITKYKLEREN